MEITFASQILQYPAIKWPDTSTNGITLFGLIQVQY